MLKRPTLAVTALALALTASACVGQKEDKEPISKDKSPAEVMEMAKKELDDTSGLEISIEAEDLPNSVQALEKAEGTGVHPAAFEGEITVSVAGLPIDADVVAVDDKVYAKLPGADWATIDPADYGAPDPAILMATDNGLSDLLVETKGLKQGKEERGGDDNKDVFVTYTGTLTGDQVSRLIPTADGDSFDVRYLIDSDGRLREAEITGVFYEDTDEMTYVIDLDDYGTEKDIKAP